MVLTYVGTVCALTNTTHLGVTVCLLNLMEHPHDLLKERISKYTKSLCEEHYSI